MWAEISRPKLKQLQQIRLRPALFVGPSPFSVAGTAAVPERAEAASCSIGMNSPASGGGATSSVASVRDF